MANAFGFQLIRRIHNDDSLLLWILLPAAFKNKLPPRINVVKLIDSRNREYDVKIHEFRNHEYKMGLGQWRDFYDRAISIDREITTLCFRLERPNVFRVLCFNDVGIEITQDNIGVPVSELQISRCLVTATDSTSVEQALPSCFLRELKILTWKVKIITRKQNGEVNIIYKKEEGKEYARAEGFRGAKWTNVCYENDVEDEFSLLFTKYFNKEFYFYVDIFNKKGIGIGLALNPENEPPVANVMPGPAGLLDDDEMFNLFVYRDDPDDTNGDSTAEDDLDETNGDSTAADDTNGHSATEDAVEMDEEEQEWIDSDSENEDVDMIHNCRILHHEHSTENPHCLVKFKSFSLNTSYLTIPKDFVNRQKLYGYNKATLHFGHLEFHPLLRIMKDDRRPRDFGHMVCVLDWYDFKETTGIMEHECIRFELIIDKSATGDECHFNICKNYNVDVLKTYLDVLKTDVFWFLLHTYLVSLLGCRIMLVFCRSPIWQHMYAVM